MKKIAIGIALASMAPWCSPAFAQQIVSGAGSVALNATGEADGVAFINQGVNETTLSATIGQNINTNQNAVGVSTNAANRGNILFSGGAGGFLQFLER